MSVPLSQLPAPRGAVFLSYASQDAGAAQRICDALRAVGVEVWFDQNELVGGDAWDAKIRKQIAECALFVPIISASTQARLEGYFRIEWKLAARRTHAMATAKAFLLPIVIDATHDAEAHVPDEFRDVQWTRLPGADAPEKFCARVQTLLGGESKVAGRGLPTPPSQRHVAAIAAGSGDPALHRKPTRRIPVAAAIAGTLLIVAAIGVSLWLRRPASVQIQPPDPRRDASAATTTPAAAQKSVAVLAFKNLSGDPAREFFSDGLSEAVTDVLGRVPGLKVVGSASAFSFKGQSVPIPEIARQLGVTHLVDGTMIQDGSTVRITAKLIQADGFQVWVSDKLERDAKNIFALHDEVAGLIAKNLSLKLGASSAAATATVNPQAFELYVQARQAWGLRTAEGFAQAELLLNRTLELEPNFARAHAALADVWTTSAGATASLGLYRLRNSATIQKSTAAARRAIDLDPNLAEAHAALGNVQWNNWQIAEAIVSLRTAIRLNSNYAAAHQWLGRVLATDGQMDEALAALRRAHELEPLAHKIADNLGLVLYSAGRHRETLTMVDRALAIQPNSIWALSVRGWALTELGEADAAVAAVRQVSGETPTTWKANATYALARAGARAEALAMLKRIEPADRSACAAAALLVLGQTDECWHALEQGSRNILSADELLFWPVFDSIRGEIRFEKILADLGLTEAHDRAQAWRQAHPPQKPAAKN